ncbi:hypothetical protein AAG906_027973 [Vitis piasezkii]
MAELYRSNFPQLGLVALRFLRFCLHRRWHRDGTSENLGEDTGDGTGDGSGDCSVKSMGSELSTLGLFCNGRPPDLEKLLLAAEAQKRVLELVPFAGFSCGLKKRKTWPLWFAPFRVAEIWLKWMIGEDEAEACGEARGRR